MLTMGAVMIGVAAWLHRVASVLIDGLGSLRAMRPMTTHESVASSKLPIGKGVFALFKSMISSDMPPTTPTPMSTSKPAEPANADLPMKQRRAKTIAAAKPIQNATMQGNSRQWGGSSHRFPYCVEASTIIHRTGSAERASATMTSSGRTIFTMPNSHVDQLATTDAHHERCDDRRGCRSPGQSAS